MAVKNSLNIKIEKIQKESQMPGLQVSVTENGNEIFSYLNGLRAINHKSQITNEDKWHLGSCTKPMTAFLIGQLIDQKKINWDTKLENIIPQNQKIHTSLKKITISQLLTHSSGLEGVQSPDNGKLWPTLFTDKKTSVEMRNKLVNGIFSLPAKFLPGSKYEYSNSGYVVLGWIIETLEKDSWENIISKRIFSALGMNSCGFGSPGVESQQTPIQPWGHEVKNNKMESLKPGFSSDNPSAIGPAGTVNCNVNDWRKFLSLYLNKTSQRIVSKQTLEKLKSNVNSKEFYTFSSMGRMDREWAKGTVFTMAGSNTLNYAMAVVAPELNRIYTINTNLGNDKAEEAVTKIVKELTTIK